MKGRRADFSAPTSTRAQRELATSNAVTALSRHPDITGIVVVSRWIDGSFLVSTRARAELGDEEAETILRRMAIEAIGDVSR